MRFAGIVFALAALAAVVTPHTAFAADSADSEPPGRFEGAFRFTGSTREEAERKAAIDRGIDSLFFAIRGIARSRLSAGTKIDPWVAFAVDADKIRFRTPAAPEAVSPESGTPVDYVNDGERIKLSQRVAGPRLTQMFVAGQGRRMNEWLLSEDANKLWLKVTVSSPKLTRPIVYTLTYERLP
jgi:hypothetical protein